MASRSLWKQALVLELVATSRPRNVGMLIDQGLERKQHLVLIAGEVQYRIALVVGLCLRGLANVV